jgi:hypothetical protein
LVWNIRYIWAKLYPISLETYILVFSVIIELAPVVFYLVNRKKINDKNLRVIFLLLVIGLLNDAYGVYCIWKEKENFLFYNSFLLFETLLLSTFFYQVFRKKPAKIVVVVMACFCVAAWIFIYKKVGHTAYYNNFTTLENSLLLCYVLYYYFERILISNSEMIYSDPKFWIITGYLVFTSGTFFLLLYYPTLTIEERSKFYILNYVFAIIKTVLLTVAMFMKNKPEPPKNFN